MAKAQPTETALLTIAELWPKRKPLQLEYERSVKRHHGLSGEALRAAEDVSDAIYGLMRTLNDQILDCQVTCTEDLERQVDVVDHMNVDEVGHEYASEQVHNLLASVRVFLKDLKCGAAHG